MAFADNDLSFNVLGPLEVYARGRLVGVGSPKHRVLLATLLLKAGSPVSNRELAVAVWGSHQPESPRRAVQLIVSRLRTLLGGASIATCTDGYLMDIRPERLDLGRFRYWLEQADLAASRSDLDMEAAALAEALVQWRGEPLVDVPSDLLKQHVARLAEQRLQALERRIDVELRLGHHLDLVDELLEATTQNPLRERFWAQRMTALHRSGRRAEALEVYHMGRQHIVAELGIEPGDEMRRLQGLILGHVPTDQDNPAVMLPVPRQLPSELPVFVGRKREIAELDRLITGEERESRPAVLISGTAGVGKTALALHWSRRAADQFPDGQLWVDLHGYDHRPMTSPEQALKSFLHALGVPEMAIPPDLDSRSALYRSLMDGRQALVVLDNARTAEQVRPLLPGSPCSAVIVTSRSQLTGLVAAECAHAMVLNVLSRHDSREMLIKRLGADRINAEPAATQRMVEQCARLPLTLAIAAARAAQQPHQSLQALADRLQATQESLDEFTDSDAAIDLRAVFSWSYRTLSKPAARLFRLLGLHPGTDVTAPTVASLAAVPLDEVRPLMNELTGAHLLTEYATSRYALHDLLHLYAAELARVHDSRADQEAALRRVRAHYRNIEPLPGSPADALVKV
nr:BTAD domain-containing putative transcriptional regulator [Nonomuraea diastatica]